MYFQQLFIDFLSENTKSQNNKVLLEPFFTIFYTSHLTNIGFCSLTTYLHDWNANRRSPTKVQREHDVHFHCLHVTLLLDHMVVTLVHDLFALLYVVHYKFNSLLLLCIVKKTNE